MRGGREHGGEGGGGTEGNKRAPEGVGGRVGAGRGKAARGEMNRHKREPISINNNQLINVTCRKREATTKKSKTKHDEGSHDRTTEEET